MISVKRLTVIVELKYNPIYLSEKKKINYETPLNSLAVLKDRVSWLSNVPSYLPNTYSYCTNCHTYPSTNR